MFTYGMIDFIWYRSNYAGLSGICKTFSPQQIIKNPRFIYNRSNQSLFIILDRVCFRLRQLKRTFLDVIFRFEKFIRNPFPSLPLSWGCTIGLSRERKEGCVILWVPLLILQKYWFLLEYFITVEPRLSGLVGTRRNSPDNQEYEY